MMFWYSKHSFIHILSIWEGNIVKQSKYCLTCEIVFDEREKRDDDVGPQKFPPKGRERKKERNLLSHATNFVCEVREFIVVGTKQKQLYVKKSLSVEGKNMNTYSLSIILVTHDYEWKEWMFLSLFQRSKGRQKSRSSSNEVTSFDPNISWLLRMQFRGDIERHWEALRDIERGIERKDKTRKRYKVLSDLWSMLWSWQFFLKIQLYCHWTWNFKRAGTNLLNDQCHKKRSTSDEYLCFPRKSCLNPLLFFLVLFLSLFSKKREAWNQWKECTWQSPDIIGDEVSRAWRRRKTREERERAKGCLVWESLTGGGGWRKSQRKEEEREASSSVQFPLQLHWMVFEEEKVRTKSHSKFPCLSSSFLFIWLLSVSNDKFHAVLLITL